MSLSDLIPAGGLVTDLAATSRKQALLAMCDLAQRTLHVPSRPILDAVSERERLGSTGIGNGVAIPHARTSLVDRTCAVFARLRQPVDFEAIDNRPADLIFLLLAPEESGADHLKALARISRMMRQDVVRQNLRAAPDAEALHMILTSEADAKASAS